MNIWSHQRLRYQRSQDVSWKESKEKNSSGLDDGGMVATAELSPLGQQ